MVVHYNVLILNSVIYSNNTQIEPKLIYFYLHNPGILPDFSRSTICSLASNPNFFIIMIISTFLKIIFSSIYYIKHAIIRWCSKWKEFSKNSEYHTTNSENLIKNASTDTEKHYKWSARLKELQDMFPAKFSKIHQKYHKNEERIEVIDQSFRDKFEDVNHQYYWDDFRRDCKNWDQLSGFI